MTITVYIKYATCCDKCIESYRPTEVSLSSMSVTVSLSSLFWFSVVSIMIVKKIVAQMQ